MSHATKDIVYSNKINDFATVLRGKVINGEEWYRLARLGWEDDPSEYHIARVAQLKRTRRVHIGNIGDDDE